MPRAPQVKVRGQRLELPEVEGAVQAGLQGVELCAAFVTPRGLLVTRGEAASGWITASVAGRLWGSTTW